MKDTPKDCTQRPSQAHYLDKNKIRKSKEKRTKQKAARQTDTEWFQAQVSR